MDFSFVRPFVIPLRFYVTFLGWVGWAGGGGWLGIWVGESQTASSAVQGEHPRVAWALQVYILYIYISYIDI